MAKKKKKSLKPKAGKTKKRAAARKTRKPSGKTRASKAKGKKGRKDKFSMTWDELKESKEWKADWDDDANDFEGDSSEF